MRMMSQWNSQCLAALEAKNAELLVNNNNQKKKEKKSMKSSVKKDTKSFTSDKSHVTQLSIKHIKKTYINK